MRARENPFRTERLESLAFRPAGLSTDALWRRLARLDRRAAIVGPHGSGKTTLLRETAARLEDEGYRVTHWFLNAESPRPGPASLVREAGRLGARDVLLFDGAGHLPGVSWRCLRWAARRAGGLVVTAHAPGRGPTWIETTTDAALLSELAGELLGASPPPLAGLLEELRAAHAGNLRDVFLSLYDLAARDDARLAAAAEP